MPWAKKKGAGNIGVIVSNTTVRLIDADCRQKDGSRKKKINGKLLVCSEQGIGDEILYLRLLTRPFKKT